MALKTKLKENGLSITVFALFLLTLIGQYLTGWKAYNEEQKEHKQKPVAMLEYAGTGHFSEALFENWESEFLQMALYVALTSFLFQKGSPESKKFEGEEVDRDPDPKRKGAPAILKKGKVWREIYSFSLSAAFALLFALSLIAHGLGGVKEFNEEQIEHGQPTQSLTEFMSGSEFWFQSFQNWQSEFLAIFCVVVFSIYLRHKGSPESKPVDAPHDQTGTS